MNETGRHGSHLRQRYRIILGYTGLASLPSAGILASPLLLLTAFPQESHCSWGFLFPALALGAISTLLWHFLLPREGGYLTFSEGSVVVVLVWINSILFSAIPFWTIGELGFTQGIFESTSGWTTTGLSVIDVADTPALLLFFRSILQFAGGAGFAVIMLSALAGPSGTGLSAAEGRADQLVPQVRRSARLVVSLYLGYFLLGWPALWLSGMGIFDAVNHTLTALSTGGFSTQPDSIGAWDRPTVEAVLILLMVLGNTNFLTAFLFLRGRFHSVCRNGELHLLFFLLPISALVLFFGVTVGLYPHLGKQVRVALFEATSALTTTGFSTVSYGNWPDLGWLLIILLMVIGGGSGSTAGGIKQYRVLVLFHGLYWQIKRVLLPKEMISEPVVWAGEQRRFLSETQILQAGVFLFLYMTVLTIGTMVLCSEGFPLKTSFFEIASALGTVGLSSGITSANISEVVLWTEIVAMFFGRLEFIVIVVGLGRSAMDLPHILRRSAWSK